jgi:hypothetical protein
VAPGAGKGLAETAGAGVAAGDCAIAALAPKLIATGRISADKPKRANPFRAGPFRFKPFSAKPKRKLLKFMGYSPGPGLMSRSVGKSAIKVTRRARLRPMTVQSSALLTSPLWPNRSGQVLGDSPYKADTNRIFS